MGKEAQRVRDSQGSGRLRRASGGGGVGSLGGRGGSPALSLHLSIVLGERTAELGPSW